MRRKPLCWCGLASVSEEGVRDVLRPEWGFLRVGGNPNSLLTSNFGLSKEMLDRLPLRERGILGRKA